LEVVCYQTTNLPGLEDIGAQLVKIFRTQVGWPTRHRAAVEAVLGHFGPAHVRRPQRTQIGTVYATQDKHLVIDTLERFHVLGGKDITILDRHSNADGVTQITHIALMLEHIDNVGVLERNHLLKAGDRSYLCSLKA